MELRGSCGAGEAETALRVAIVGSDRLLREGLELALRRRGVHVVGALGHELETVFALVEARAQSVLVHVAGAERRARATLSMLRQQLPGAGLVVICAEPEPSLQRWVDLGADAVLAQREDVDELKDKLRLAQERAQARTPRLRGRAQREPVLTRRELQVIAALAAGLLNREIAEMLRVQSHTVKSHIHSALGKLSLRSRAQLASYARDRGWVQN